MQVRQDCALYKGGALSPPASGVACYILFVLLGKIGEKFILLNSDRVPENEADLMRKFSGKLDSMSPANRRVWVKEKMPSAYRAAYREVHEDYLTIIDRYPLKS